ncbi:MAG TPA: twin-arginine translocation signal domain-containing protein [Pricia antarctica]|uniref:Twin-arginine translocation signal domain-containing protein n=1 Tax=Pricia antarctica TaxID=641691 RepID=A0A831QVG2_9FLAO|nr:twin-arginine translocation signal domain-containing protein [Pricia antarctica]
MNRRDFLGTGAASTVAIVFSLILCKR